MPTLRVNDLAPRVQYVADGAQTSFTVPFFFFDPADLQVRFDDGAEAAAHAVDGAGDPEGGAVLFDDPPPAGTRVTIWREMALERGTEFQEAGAFRAATINDELDRLAMLAQELSGRIERAPAFPATATAAPVALAAPAAGKDLRWSADGLGLESVQPLEASALAVSAFGESLLDDADAAAARATLGLPAALQNGAYSYAAAAGAPDAIALAPAAPVAAYAAGQMFWFKAAATNTGPVTLAISGLAAKAVQINGAALVAGCIRANDMCVVVYDGAHFQLVSTTPGGWQLIESLTADNSATLDFTTGFETDYEHEFTLVNILPQNDAADLWVRVSNNGGATFEEGATAYEWTPLLLASNTTSSQFASGSQGDSKIRIALDQGSAAAEGANGYVRMLAPGTTAFHHLIASISFMDNGATALLRYMKTAGVYNAATTPVNGVRFMFDTGNILSGKILHRRRLL